MMCSLFLFSQSNADFLKQARLDKRSVNVCTLMILTAVLILIRVG